MIRVVLATDSAEPSGMGEHMLALGAALEGCEVTIACQEGPNGRALLTRAARLGLRIKIIENGPTAPFRAWLERTGVDLLHVHAGIGWEGHGLVRAGKAAGLPVVRTEHLPYLLTSPVQQAEYRAMLASVDRRIAVSDAVSRSHRDTGEGRQFVIRNGIAPCAPQRSAGETRRALGLGDTDRLMLTIARLTPQKHHEGLLAAIPVVLAAEPRARFVLVGSGPGEAAIRDAIAEAGLGDSVHLLGQRDDVPDLLAAADLFVLPSRFEGLSLALLEAIAAGLPTVATAVDGNLEALGPHHPLLVPPGDSAALASAILAALADGEMAAASARSALERFETGFTAARMAAETRAIYQSLPALGTPGIDP
jgi:glycosyltransferase involved in cell wall biosynthesis